MRGFSELRQNPRNNLEPHEAQTRPRSIPREYANSIKPEAASIKPEATSRSGLRFSFCSHRMPGGTPASPHELGQKLRVQESPPISGIPRCCPPTAEERGVR